MQRASYWRRNDGAKLLVIGLAMLLGMPVLIAAANGPNTFLAALALGLAACGLAGYWLGSWKWIFIPLLAMLAEIIFAIPLSLLDPQPVETPISIVLEAPFWTGLPALIGAGAGYLIRRGVGAFLRYNPR